MWFILPYYHKIFIFAVWERRLIYDCKTECNFIYLIVYDYGYDYDNDDDDGDDDDDYYLFLILVP